MQLMRFAFQIQEFQVSGQPSWFNTERFDIAARAPRGVAADKADAWQEMLGTLLVDRFKLTYHVEPREQSVYELIVSRNGHKLKPAPRTDCVPPVPGQCGFRASVGQLIGDQVTMEAFATRLSRSLGQTVVNKTSLEGAFDFLLQWTPDLMAALPADPVAPRGGGPSIFTALQEQLGLRLEPAKGPVEVFVIDHVERPSEN